MDESHQLAIGSQLSQGLTFKWGLIACNVVEYRGRQNEKSAVDQATIARWLFDKARDPVTLALNGPIAAWRKYRRNGGETPMATVEINAGAEYSRRSDHHRR